MALGAPVAKASQQIVSRLISHAQNHLLQPALYKTVAIHELLYKEKISELDLSDIKFFEIVYVEPIKVINLIIRASKDTYLNVVNLKNNKINLLSDDELKEFGDAFKDSPINVVYLEEEGLDKLQLDKIKKFFPPKCSVIGQPECPKMIRSKIESYTPFKSATGRDSPFSFTEPDYDLSKDQRFNPRKMK